MKNLIIIAEVGVNHNGNISLAKTYQSCKNCGADYVKFQCFETNSLVTNNAKSKLSEKFGAKQTQKQMLKKYELKKKDLIYLKNIVKKLGLNFFYLFDIGSLNILNRIGLKLVKIPSGELNNFELIEQVVGSKKKLFCLQEWPHLQR